MPSTQRSRNRGGFSEAVASITVNCYEAPPYQNHTRAENGTTEEMVDYVSRPFKPGVTWMNNPMSKVQITKTASPGTSVGQSGWPPKVGDPISWSGEYYGPDFSGDFHQDMLDGSLFDYSALNQQAATQALSKVSKPEVYGAVALKELKKTIDGLIHPLTSLSKFLQASINLKRGKSVRRKKGAARDLSAAAADQHLAVIFGAMPFINDCQAILKALEDGPKVHLDPIKVRGQASDSSESTRIVTVSGGEHYTLKYRRDVVATAYLIYKVEFEAFTNRMGLSLEEIPRAVWQTLPYSFLVDWAFGVGAYLGAITPRTGVTILAQGLKDTIVDTHSAEMPYASFTEAPAWTWRKGGAAQTRVVVTTNRVPADLMDYAAITRLRSRESKLDLFRVTALLSLITQRAAKLYTP